MPGVRRRAEPIGTSRQTCGQTRLWHVAATRAEPGTYIYTRLEPSYTNRQRPTIGKRDGGSGDSATRTARQTCAHSPHHTPTKKPAPQTQWHNQSIARAHANNAVSNHQASNNSNDRRKAANNQALHQHCRGVWGGGFVDGGRSVAAHGVECPLECHYRCCRQRNSASQCHSGVCKSNTCNHPTCATDRKQRAHRNHCDSSRCARHLAYVRWVGCAYHQHCNRNSYANGD